MQNDHGDMEDKISHLLMQLRKAPNSTRQGAYNLMFGREVRTKFDVTFGSKGKNTECHIKDSSRKTRRFEVGDRVQARNYVHRQPKWSFGTILSRQGNLYYEVKMDSGAV